MSAKARGGKTRRRVAFRFNDGIKNACASGTVRASKGQGPSPARCSGRGTRMDPATGQGMMAPDPRTAPATVRRRTAETENNTSMRRRALTTVLLLLLPLLAGWLCGPARAWSQERETTLPESGIRYPRGYDVNTVSDVRGTVRHLLSQPQQGPVRFELVCPRDTYTILASPAWFWSEVGSGVQEGIEVKVRGSKSMGKDGKLYLVAQEIQILSTGTTFSLRDDDGSPLWGRHRDGGAGTHGGRGGGSPHGGFGATGGAGPGGRGSGGRR